MRTIEEKRSNLNSFISYCLDKKNEHIPEGYTYQDISKVISERYPTQEVEVVRVFFKSTDVRTNNKPYTYPEELPIGTATMISNDLLEARTTVKNGYGAALKPKVIPVLLATNNSTNEEQKLLDLLYN